MGGGGFRPLGSYDVRWIGVPAATRGRWYGARCESGFVGSGGTCNEGGGWMRVRGGLM